MRAAAAAILSAGGRPLILGGCCTPLIGALAAARVVLGPVGLAYVDGHLDLYDQVTSPTGQAADMPLAALLGRGQPDLLAAAAPTPVLDVGRVWAIGAHDPDEAADLGTLPMDLGLVVVAPATVAADPVGVGAAAAAAVGCGAGFWLHLDVDVLDGAVFPATDFAMPGGLDLAALASLLAPMGRDHRLVGASIACYNPELDADGRCGDALVDLLVRVLS